MVAYAQGQFQTRHCHAQSDGTKHEGCLPRHCGQYILNTLMYEMHMQMQRGPKVLLGLILSLLMSCFLWQKQKNIVNHFYLIFGRKEAH